MIICFKCKNTELLWETGRCRKFPSHLIRVALRKLLMLHSAHHIDDLRVPPSNKLKSLCGDRKDQWSIRINQQWRLCFRWKDHEAFDVEIIDYH